MVEAPNNLAPVERDWLWGLKCRLCNRESPHLEEARFAFGIQDKRFPGMPINDAARVRIAHNVCWWCFYRVASWRAARTGGFKTHIVIRGVKLERRLGYFSPSDAPISVFDVIEFTAHVIKTKPKWLGNPSAYHPRMTTEEKRAIGYTYNHHNQHMVRRKQ